MGWLPLLNVIMPAISWHQQRKNASKSSFLYHEYNVDVTFHCVHHIDVCGTGNNQFDTLTPDEPLMCALNNKRIAVQMNRRLDES